jgi:hypothetical protein
MLPIVIACGRVICDSQSDYRIFFYEEHCFGGWTQLPFEHGFDTASPAGTAAKELTPPVPAGRDEQTGLPIRVLITGRRLR